MEDRERPRGDTTPPRADLLDTLRKNHDEAFLYVAQGLSYEEQGEHALAAEMYYKGLDRLDNGLDIRCEHPNCVGQQWDDARTLQRKMSHIKNEVEFRLHTLADVIEAGRESTLYADKPPTYDEAVGSEQREAMYKDAEQLLSIDSDVQIFFVSPEGEVTSPPVPTDLHVYRFANKPDSGSSGAADARGPLAWLQVGTWIYPLVPNESPALRSAYGAYLFPDVDSSARGGATVGVLLPSSLTPEMHSLFESLMEELTAMKIQTIIIPRDLEAGVEPRSALGPVRMRRDARFSEKVSSSIIAGSEMLSKGLNKGAVLTSEALRMGAVRLKQYLKPELQPIAIDPRVKQGMELLRNVTGSVKGVSETIVNKVGDLTVALGKQVAKNVACDSPVAGVPTTSSTMSDVIVIASGGVKGFSNLYMGLENAARILASSLANETVQIVGHKYGTDAAQVVDHAMYSVGNVALATNSIKSLGIRGLAKRTAKETGKSILQEYVSTIEQNAKFRGDSTLALNYSGSNP